MARRDWQRELVDIVHPPSPEDQEARNAEQTAQVEEGRVAERIARDRAEVDRSGSVEPELSEPESEEERMVRELFGAIDG